MSHNFKKSLGQNFLKDKKIIEQIINYIDLEQEEVLEIGPGQGAITEFLVKKTKNVVAYEIDQELIPYLNKKIKSDNFELKNEDFLKANLIFENKKIVVANIPYYITSDILFKLFKNHLLFKKALIMVQNEIAEKLVAKPGESNYGKLSVSAQFFCEIKKAIFVSKVCFIPQPKVDSAVVFFDFKKIPSDFDIKSFLEFIKNCFSQQRKKLVNNLKNKYEIGEINKALQKMELPLNIRPQQIDLKNYKILFKELN